MIKIIKWGILLSLSILVFFVFLYLFGYGQDKKSSSDSIASSDSVDSLQDIPFYWKGTITVRQKSEGFPSLSGVYDTQWTLHVRLKEGEKYDVKTKDGRLVGQFVKLEDYGSTWSGEETGSYSITTDNTHYEGSFTGEKSGTGNVFNEAYIYYSLYEKDPVREVLPSQSYFICARSGFAAKFSTHEVKTSTSLSSGHTNTSNIPWDNMAMLNYFIGKLFFGPSPKLSDPLYAEDVVSRLSNFAMPSYDTKIRVIQDGHIKGSYTNTQDMGKNMGVPRRIINSASWDISKRLDLHPVLEKAEENWRPQGNGFETPIKISAKMEEYPSIDGKWRFTLFEVSKEKGYCMNAGEGDDFDFEFVSGQPGFSEPEKTSDGWKIETTETRNQATVRVIPNDYGAWTKIKAEINVEGEWYKAISEDSQEYVTIPRDDDEDHIADFWEEEYGVAEENARSDTDQKPEKTGGNREPGDGFSNYEEYRGFKMNGSWADTNPTHKDLFLCDQIGFGDGYYGEATGIHVHLITSDEFNGTDSRVVNFNRGYGTLPSQDGQKGLLLIEGELDPGVEGRASNIGTPNVVKYVKIETTSGAAMRAYKRYGSYEAAPFFKNRACTITHELGHATNLTHHGNIEAFEGDTSIAREGGLYSGNVDCFMRYRGAEQYIFKDGSGPYEYPDEQEPEYPTIFCEGKKGNGFNAAGYEPTQDDQRPYPVAGDATEGGACLKNITLKGYHYNGN